jgi:hypothetical protein
VLVQRCCSRGRARSGARYHAFFTDTALATVDAEPAPTTVRDRLTAAGLSDERIAEHMTAGRVRVDGELVTDLDAPAPVGTRVVVWS